MLDEYRVMRSLIRSVDSGAASVSQADLKGRLVAAKRLAPSSLRYEARIDRAVERCLAVGLVERDGDLALAPTVAGRAFVHRLRFARLLARRYRAVQVSAWSLFISIIGFIGVAGLDMIFEVLQKAAQ